MFTEADVINMFSNVPERMFYDITSDSWEDVLSYLSFPGATYFSEWGASKGVLIFEGCEWVIKVPFTGRDNLSYSCWQETWRSEDHYSETYRPSINEYYEFSEAVNSQNCWDYCLAEVEVYQNAVKAGLADLFAETRLFCTLPCGHPIYIQRKVETIGTRGFCDKIPASHEEKTSIERVINMDINSYRRLPVKYLLSILREYGEAMASRFKAFVEELGLSDFHEGNVGVHRGSLIFVDYSGYYE